MNYVYSGLGGDYTTVLGPAIALMQKDDLAPPDPDVLAEAEREAASVVFPKPSSSSSSSHKRQQSRKSSSIKRVPYIVDPPPAPSPHPVIHSHNSVVQPAVAPATMATITHTAPRLSMRMYTPQEMEESTRAYRTIIQKLENTIHELCDFIRDSRQKSTATSSTTPPASTSS